MLEFEVTSRDRHIGDLVERECVSTKTLIEHPQVWQGFNGGPAIAAHATGFEDLDAYLPGGGWPVAALIEIIVERHGIGELSLLMPTMARLSEANIPGQMSRWIFWISPPFIPYAPALARHGVDLNRLLLVHAPLARSENLWAMEQALRAKSCVAVLAWTRQAEHTALRRLQLAAEQSNCWAVLFRSADALEQRSPAALRLKLVRTATGIQIEILKCRGARPGVVHIRHDVSEALSIE